MTRSRSFTAQHAQLRFWSLPAPQRSVVLVLLALSVGCSRRLEPDSTKADSQPSAPAPLATAPQDVAPPVPRVTSAPQTTQAPQAVNTPQAAHWIAELRAVHAQLDAAKGASAQREALRAVERLFESAAPQGTGVTSAPELLPLRQDLASRAAQVELALGQAASAGRWAQRGLALSTAPSLFRANLLLDAAEARRLEGDDAGARAALLDAMQVNQHLLEEELENP